MVLAFIFSIVSLFSPHAPVSIAGELAGNWKGEWEATVEGAKKEGRLSLYLYQGDGELEAVANEFQKKYPEIAVTKSAGERKSTGSADYG